MVCPSYFVANFFRMITGLVNYKSSQIAWARFGNGPEPVLCFHGYGEDAQRFASLRPATGERFTLLAIDLPFHGRTQWREGLRFTPDDLRQIAMQVLVENGFHADFLVLGYSLGGRVALSLYETMPEKVTRMVLLAPDGLKMNFWYWLATQTWMGNRLFRFTMYRPGWFFGMLRVLNRLGLVNSSIFKFVKHAIGDASVRQALYERWTAFRRLKPNLRRLRGFISTNNTPVRLLYGSHDRIILPAPGERFRVGIEKQVKIEIIASGHQLLQEKHRTAIFAALLP